MAVIGYVRCCSIGHLPKEEESTTGPRTGTAARELRWSVMFWEMGEALLVCTRRDMTDMPKHSGGLRRALQQFITTMSYQRIFTVWTIAQQLFGVDLLRQLCLETQPQVLLPGPSVAVTNFSVCTMS
jgi:hypothetical protein